MTNPTQRITVTLPNLSGYAAEAVAQQLRHRLLEKALHEYEEAHGAFTEEDLAEAHARIAASSAADQPEAA